MTAIPSEGWHPLPPGELDRLQGRLRWRRWLRNLATVAAIAVVLATVALATVQAVNVVNRWTGPATPACNPSPSTSTSDCDTPK